ncbi:glutamine--fructose-6-phosphate transaminase (isomerizing) [Longirhabdus pacifica]|uniref:glutamine--fructose-6-phosphate transaminase (isomerizing) n=1 Tax=Longirhabdus pacifica TaxID=2305227 RepID=UPI0010086B10|nr:glutamine--fructose-6-phosphate transaminase (isomerizing) [Longirhabdus pacifica]
MCGIVGYIGNREAQSILISGLSKLEYRGYDSAGISVYNGKALQTAKKKGRLAVLEEQLQSNPLNGHIGIGHTRWATHGKPSDENAHPHSDNDHQFSIIHNGIIENYLSLKEELVAKGHVFKSETDTEVIAHLIQSLYEGDMEQAVQRAVKKMKGAYALVVLSKSEPDKLIAVRLASPLIVGVGQGENFIGSDIPAILEYTRNVYILNDGEMAVLTRNDVQLKDVEGNSISREIYHVDWDIVTAEKDGYDHFMLKEIHEQPKGYRDTMGSRIQSDQHKVDLKELTLSKQQIESIDRIHIVACGTAYHAGLVGKQVLESMTRIPVEVDVASEYRYRNPIITNNTLVIIVSQSGETADTLAALREAKSQGATILAITNVVGSSVTREADQVLITWAGPEIAVASTKAYTTQLITFYLLGCHFAEVLETKDEQFIAEVVSALQVLPEQVEMILSQAEDIKRYAEHIAQHDHVFFLGRGLDFAVAQEASLKLKEISYIHSEAYAAGELKHGTLALIEEGTPVVAIATQEDLFDKTVSNIQEVVARGADVLGLSTVGDEELVKSVNQLLFIPKTLPFLTPALSIIPLQLLSYYAAMARGTDVDKPRNLAKSVTVE